MYKISVLIPCYNAQNTLTDALSSLFEQTYQDFEIVAVDDGSTDHTCEILDMFARQDERMRVLYLPHQGLITALNSGLAMCCGDYVACMDSDDIAWPHRLEKQSAYLDDNPEIALVSCLVRAFPSTQVRGGFIAYVNWLNGLVRDEDIQREIYIESPLPHPTVMFRRKWVQQVGLYQEHGWPEDYDLWLRMAHAGARFAKIPEVLLDWREHPDRITRTDSRYSLENFLRCKAYYLSQGPLKGERAVLVWGAGMTGRRISKHLIKANVPLVAFLDVDPKKIGRTMRGLPILASDQLATVVSQYNSRVKLLAAVGSRNARPLIRKKVSGIGLREGTDWWCVA